MDDTITSSPCLDTDALTLEKDILGSKFNIMLDLKGRTRNPKVLSLFASLLEKFVEDNETWLQTTHTKDNPTVFHGSRAPTLTIQQYVERIFKYSRFFNNAYYARVGGVSTAELNRLEIKFLFGIDFQLYVNLSTFERYCLELMSETPGEEVQIERPLLAIHDACGLKEKWSKNNIDTSYHPTIGVHIH